jgi:uracil-DNA glycosylase family 4
VRTDERMSALNDLSKEINSCRLCEIAKNRTHAVPGEGAENADIMFIGEAPGWNEDQQARPFVGAAGQFLDELIRSIGLDRQKVFIANVIKCRPPDNRDPLPTEITNCRPFLEQQIQFIAPKIIVTLGRYSMGMFFPGKTISKIHGTHQTVNGITYFAMYHPAAALHQGNLRETLKQDIKKLPPLLAEIIIKQEPEKPPPDIKQLSLF